MIAIYPYQVVCRMGEHTVLVKQCCDEQEAREDAKRMNETAKSLLVPGSTADVPVWTAVDADGNSLDES